MSPNLRGIVVGHADLAFALVNAVEQISGVPDALVAVSNANCNRGLLEERIDHAVGGHPSIVFVDMPSGSCLVAAMRRLAERPEVRVVTGVNLAMLLDFVFHRDLPLDEATARAIETGSKAILKR